MFYNKWLFIIYNLDLMPQLYDLLLRFILDIVSVAILLFGIYYPRYKTKETAVSAALFNIFAFATLSVLASVQFGITAGFGLFAILALFNLRSEQIGKSDIAYFFGSLSIAVITSIQGTQISFVILMLAIVLVAVFIIDHPKILRSANQLRVTLDHIPAHVASDTELLNRELSTLLGVKVVSSPYMSE